MELISFGVFDKPIFLDGTDGTKKLSIVLQSKIEANTPRAADLIFHVDLESLDWNTFGI